LIVAGVLVAAGSAPAYAGDWMKAVCANPNGSPAGVAGWTLNVGPSVSLADSYIGPASGAPVENGEQGCLFFELASAGPNDTATFQYTPPAGSTLDGGWLNLESYLPGAQGQGGSGWFFWPAASAPDSFSDPTSVFWQQTDGGPYGWGGGPPWGPTPGWVSNSVSIPQGVGGDLHTGLAMTWPIASAVCGVPDTRQFCTFQVNSGGILLANDSSPAGSDLGGSLLASGSVSGTADLTFSATDPGGGGVYRVIVKIDDGNTVYEGTPNTNGGQCVSTGTDPTSGAWIFDSQQPCPQTVDLDIPVNTTALSDGHHQVQVIVQDVAQNSSTVLDQTITTDNYTTVAGTTSEGTASAASTPSIPPAPYALKLDPATAALTASVVHSRYTASGMTLSGQVLQAGAPAPQVTVTVQAGSLSGTGYTTVAKTTTNAAGQFTLTVPRGDSRDLEITAGAENVTFQQLVTPNVSMSVRSLPGARILFTGHVAIDTTAGPSPFVEIECYDPESSDHWPNLTTTTVAADGGFRYVYHATPLLAGNKFKFRAFTPALTGYWQAAVSAVKEAKVTL
jgi:hypothetical protein